MTDALTFHADPPLSSEAQMVVGFSGWMDGGEVSTGATNWLVKQLDMAPLAEIDPEPFSVYSFPGSMELAQALRPEVKIEDGVLEKLETPTNRFSVDVERELIVLEGREPHFAWSRFTECVLEVARRFNVSWIWFVGSVGGAVPHTREPRFYSAVSDIELEPRIAEHGFRPTEYEGPAHYVTHLMGAAQRREVPMMTVVAEVPAYIEGMNPRCIEAAARQLSAVLGLRLDLSELRDTADAFERKFDESVQEHEELAEKVQELENEYDNEQFHSQMPELKNWLQQRGIRLD